ncbi:MAG: serine hydrolase domain-containing protein [Lewinella sp.]
MLPLIRLFDFGRGRRMQAKGLKSKGTASSSALPSNTSLHLRPRPNQLATRKLQWILLLLALWSAGLNAQVVSKAESPELKEFIDKEISELFNSVKAVGGSIAFVEGNRITYVGGFGFEDREAGVKARPTTLYRTASMTKSMTAIAVLQLVEAGKIDLNAPISQYLPELNLYDANGRKESPRIKDILTHLSGLPGDILNGMIPAELPSEDWLMKELDGQRLSAPANFTQSYSNVGYGLLGQLIERVSNQSYGSYLDDHVFKPLGMSTAGLPETHGIGKLSKGYVDKKEIILDHPPLPAASAVIASVLDMAELLKMFLDHHKNGERVLSAASRKMMQTNYLTESFLPIAYGYGFGLDVRQGEAIGPEGTQPIHFYKHSGNEIAFQGAFGYLPELEVGVVIMTNTKRGFLACDTKALIDLYLKHKKGISTTFDYSLPDTEITSPTPQEILGSYNIGPAGLKVTDPNSIKFKIQGNKVVLNKRANSMVFDVKFKLLGFIPIRVKDVVFEFIKKEGRIFLRQVDVARNTPEYLAERIVRTEMGEAWRRRLGRYTLTNPIPANNKRFNYAAATFELQDRNGWPVLLIETPGMKLPLCLTVISDNLAVTGGMGRQAGDGVTVLPDGRIRFSGFELQIAKE